MLKIALCDDDISALSKLNQIIIQYCKKESIKVIINTYMTGEELLVCCKRFDVIFLDIKMNEMGGIEVAKQIRKKDTNVKIIYVTAFSDYQNYAFSVHAFGYITKPYDQETICNILVDVIEYIKSQSAKPTLCLKIDNGMLHIDAENIYYFEYSSRKMKVVHSSGICYANYGVEELIEKVGEFNFIAPHKSFIINLLHVMKIKGYEIYMRNGEVVPLSQKRSAAVRDAYMVFLQGTYYYI
jgi:two-component system, LytTR family, response regulator